MHSTVRLYWSEAGLLLFIFVNEFALASILFATPLITGHSFVLNACLFAVQMLFAPLQAGISDHYCRKTSLILAWCGVVLSQTFLTMAFFRGIGPLIVSLILFGALGNITPVSRAALIDVVRDRYRANGRPVSRIRTPLGLSTMAMTMAWAVSLLGIRRFSPPTLFLISSALSIVCIPITLFMLNDKQDKKFKWSYLLPHGEMRGIVHLMRVKWFRGAAAVYTIAWFCYYLVIGQGESKPFSFMTSYLVNVWVLAYCMGVVIVLFSKLSDKAAVRLGISLSAISFMFTPLLPANQTTVSLFSLLINSLIAIGYGVFVPALYSWIASKQHVHRLGVIFGLVESLDTAALGLTFAMLALISGQSWYWIFGTCVLGLVGSSAIVFKITRADNFRIE